MCFRRVRKMLRRVPCPEASPPRLHPAATPTDLAPIKTTVNRKSGCGSFEKTNSVYVKSSSHCVQSVLEGDSQQIKLHKWIRGDSIICSHRISYRPISRSRYGPRQGPLGGTYWMRWALRAGCFRRMRKGERANAPSPGSPDRERANQKRYCTPRFPLRSGPV